MIGISTHVLDTALGRPARGMRVSLELASANGAWSPAGDGTTDGTGRISQFVADDDPLQAGVYRLIFHVQSYFEGADYLYPEITVQFLVRDPASHYHIPLLLSPYGYTTYRGA